MRLIVDSVQQPGKQILIVGEREYFYYISKYFDYKFLRFFW